MNYGTAALTLVHGCRQSAERDRIECEEEADNAT